MASETSSASRIENELQELANEVGFPGRISADKEKDLLSGTLEACLKLLLKQKSAADDSVVRLREELAMAKERMKKLEQAVRGRGSKAKLLARKLSEAEKERVSLLGELKLCHQQLKEDLEKKEKLQNLYTESLKTKNSQIKVLEKENQALRQARARRVSPESSGDPSDVSPAQSSRENLLASKASDEVDVNPSEQSVSTGFAASQENSNWDPYFGGIMVSQDDVDEMVDDFDLLQLSFTEALRAKNERIQQLEEEFEGLNKQKKISMSQLSILSSELSLDSYQDEDLSSYFGSQELASSSAPAHVLRHAINRRPYQPPRSFFLSDREPRRRSVPDRFLRKPRPDIRHMQMESLDSVSPCSTPTCSGSATPTSIAGSYSGILGISKSLTKKLSDAKKEKELQNTAAVDSHKQSMSSEPTRVHYKTSRDREREAAKVSGDGEMHETHQAPTPSIESETKQSRTGYTTKRQREKELREKSVLIKSGRLTQPSEVAAVSSKAISLDLSISPSVHESTGEDNLKEINRGDSVLKHAKNEPDSEERSLNKNPIDPSSSSLSDNHLSSGQVVMLTTSTPKWKKELIQKKKSSGSSLRGPPANQEDLSVEPEWVKKAQKKREVCL